MCEGRNEKCKFLARGSVKSPPLCEFTARESVANFSGTMVTSLPSLSLSVSLSLYLSLSPSAPLAQYRKRFRASYTSNPLAKERDTHARTHPQVSNRLVQWISWPAMQWHAHKRCCAFLSGNLTPLFLRLQYILNVFKFRSFVTSLSLSIAQKLTLENVLGVSIFPPILSKRNET